MPELSGFLPSIASDNKQGYQFLADWIAALISNGTYTTELQVTADTDMTVTLPVGRAWINGIYYHNTTVLKKTLAHADGVLARIDSVILRLDFTTRKITSQVLQGAYSAQPVAPALTRTENTWDLKLADVYIGAGAITISQTNITDCRFDASVCGIVHCVVDKIDTTQIADQLEQYIEEYVTKTEADYLQYKSQLNAVITELQNAVDNALSGVLPDRSVTSEKFADGAKAPAAVEAEKAERLKSAVKVGNADFDGSEDITAEQMGVRPDTWVPTPAQVGAEPAFTKNNAFNKNFGSAAGTVCQGNDGRLSNARPASNIGMGYNGSLYISYS